jgi:DNA-binding NarL/FixJ family response regulator
MLTPGESADKEADGVFTPFQSRVAHASLLSMERPQRREAMLTVTRAVEPDSLDRDFDPASRRRQLRLMVVDDHPAVRLGVVQLLEGQRDFNVELVCIDAEGAVAEAELHGIDVAILDYHLGGRNGLWACRRLKQLEEPPRVIVYSAFANDHLATCCAVAGADGVLSKGGLGSELCDAVRSVDRGRRVLPKPSQPTADMLRRRLDDTEQTIFGMLMAGIPRVAISQTLDISAGELSCREAAMLRKIEALPGEVSSVQSYLCLERC